MNKHRRPFFRGFTLIELLVVVAIISILAGLILTVVFEARKEARDNARMTTAEQLKLGVRLLKEAEGTYPQYNNGIRIGTGGALDTRLKPFLPELPDDPLGGAGYDYWYYSNFDCGGVVRNVIVVKKMEHSDNGNYDEVCDSGGQAVPKTHMLSLMSLNTALSTLSAFILPKIAYAQNISSNTANCRATTVGNCHTNIGVYPQTLPAGGGNVEVCWDADGGNTVPPSGDRYLEQTPPIPARTWGTMSSDSTSGGDGWSRIVNVTESTTFTFHGNGSCSVSNSVAVDLPVYTQSGYYTQNYYYTQAPYYTQSGYYSQATYPWTEDGEESGAAYIVFVN